MLTSDLGASSAAASPRWRVVAPNNRKYTAWLGGEALAALDGFDAALLWRDEWEEHGDALGRD